MASAQPPARTAPNTRQRARSIAAVSDSQQGQNAMDNGPTPAPMTLAAVLNSAAFYAALAARNQQLVELSDIEDDDEHSSDAYMESINDVIAASRATTAADATAAAPKIPQRFECETCKKTFTERGALKRHGVSHTGERRFGCDRCGKRFYRNAHLTRHQKGPCGSQPHVCSICKRQFALEDELKEHLIHHAEQTNNDSDDDERVGDAYKCTHCLMKLQSSYSLERHMRIHTGDRPFVCDHCGRSFSRVDELKLHKLKHTGQRPVPRTPMIAASPPEVVIARPPSTESP